MKDVRTPSTYFHQRGMNPDSIARLKGKLDDLLESLYEYRERYTNMISIAEEKILEQEIDKAERKRYKKTSIKNAVKVVDAATYGTPEDIADAIREAIDYKVFVRVEPYMQDTGQQMEEQIFWMKQYGNK